jgi:glycine hydroxymethyltransferase
VDDDLAEYLRASLRLQTERMRSSLILNPTENIPFEDDLAVTAGPLHGLYNSDKVRSSSERIATSTQFAGRQALEFDSQMIYAAWARALRASDATLRLLSGLHAHIVLFMSIAKPGQTVLLLPVEAGGHVSGRAILERLGLTVVEMAVNVTDMRVDIERTIELSADVRPDYVFVDRSEGLVFEDFSRLASIPGAVAIFDASQYLTNIIAGDHPNPLDSGFDLIVASVHKNFPGPQKALLATRQNDETWKRTLGGLSTFVSNMHVTSTYAAGLTLARAEWLSEYSRSMLEIAVLLEEDLGALDVPVVRRPMNLPPTHHVWIQEPSREDAFESYERLESAGILTNFRLLPYSLGHGLRLGVAAAVRLGLSKSDVPHLAELIAQVRLQGPVRPLVEQVRLLSESLWAHHRTAIATVSE